METTIAYSSHQTVVIPRKNIDISCSDLAAGALFCLRRFEAKTLEERIDTAWPSKERVVPFLSVRSGFDATLRALGLPIGSEVLVTALTIRDMGRIILEHGLVPVPVDVDPQRLDVDTASLEAAVSEKSRAILVAHLFGSRMCMDPIVGFARARGLLLFEDCAQSYIGREYQGDPRSDVRMFSFGPIKTATALGGGLFFFRDLALREKAGGIQDAWARQSQSKYLRRIMKYALISCIARRRVYGVFVGFCKLLGSDHEEILGRNVRGFAGSGFFPQIRQRPSHALLAMIRRRLERFDPARIEDRRGMARSIMDRLPDENLIGKDAHGHTFWVFPFLTENAGQLVRFLRSRGFDATRGQSSMVVIESTRDGRAPAKAVSAYARLLYLPVSQQLTERDTGKLLDALRDYEAGAGE